MAKNNIRSMRFSDAMIEIIEQQVGDTFTAKFETLVTKCAWELPRKEKELKQIQERITEEKKRLERLRNQANKVQQGILELDRATSNAARQMQWAIEALEDATKEGSK